MLHRGQGGVQRVQRSSAAQPAGGRAAGQRRIRFGSRRAQLFAACQAYTVGGKLVFFVRPQVGLR